MCPYVYSHTRMCDLMCAHRRYKYVYMHMYVCIRVYLVISTCRYYALTLTHEASQVFCFRGKLLALCEDPLYAGLFMVGRSFVGYRGLLLRPRQVKKKRTRTV